MPTLDIPSRGLSIIPESDLFRLIMKSKLDSAEKFQDWIVEEVLPSIRKTGSYTTTHVAPDRKETFELELIGIEACARMLNYSDISKLELIHAVHENNGVSTLSLPEFTPDVRITASASDLLKQNDCGIGAVAFNKLLMASGILEERTRTGKGGKPKYFKALTEHGLKYGQNDTSKHSPREVQPHYFSDSFMDLFKLVTK